MSLFISISKYFSRGSMPDKMDKVAYYWESASVAIPSNNQLAIN